MKKCNATSPSSKSHYYPVERRKKYILARRPMVVPHLENSMGWYQKFTSASCSIVHTQARDTRPSSDHSNKESTCQELPFLQVISQDLFPWINRTFFFNYMGNLSFLWGQNHRSISLETKRLGTQPLGNKGNWRKLTQLNCLPGRGSLEGIPSSEPWIFW